MINGTAYVPAWMPEIGGPEDAVLFAAKAFFFFADIRLTLAVLVGSGLPQEGPARDDALRARLAFVDGWPAWTFTGVWLGYFGLSLLRTVFSAGEPSDWALATFAVAFAGGLSLVPVLLKKRAGTWDYGPSLRAYGSEEAMFRRQIAWLMIASAGGMVLLFMRAG
jgi:hypothetical protein